MHRKTKKISFNMLFCTFITQWLLNEISLKISLMLDYFASFFRSGPSIRTYDPSDRDPLESATSTCIVITVALLRLNTGYLRNS